MTDPAELLLAFINPIIMVMALVLVLTVTARKGQTTLGRDIQAGGIFAIAVIYSMAHPVAIPTGGIIDMRGMLIASAVALLGPRVGLIALCVGLAMRGYIGGVGMVAGFTSMLCAFAGGWIWRIYVSPRKLPFALETTLLGLLTSSQSLAIFVMPAAHWPVLWLTLAPYTTACNLLGTFVFKYMLDDQMANLLRREGLEKAAKTDHLTGLYNRRTLEEEFPQLMKNKPRDEGMTAFYFDIDHFKLINDTYGHAAGDTVLKVLTDRLATAFRSKDLFCRLGGDEFVVLLPNLSKDEAARIAERCRLLVADQPISVKNVKVHATISIGAVWTRKELSFDGLLQMADQALYEAKAMGRNAVAFKSRIPIRPPQSTPKAAAA